MKSIESLRNGPARLILGAACLTLIVGLAACSNADMAQLGAVGKPADIVCYSGGKVILQDRSTGKIASEDRSDGWYYQSAKAFPGKLVRVSGQCIVSN